MRHYQRQRRGHISLAGMRRAGPVTKLTALRGAAPDIRQRDAAEQGVMLAGEDEIGLALLLPTQPVEPGKAAAIAIAGQGIRGPEIGRASCRGRVCQYE